MTGARKRVAIMISGRGSNMATLIEAATDPAFPAEIVGVVCDQPTAAGLHFAAGRGIPTQILARGDHADKQAHEAAIEAALNGFGADLVAMAGYMRMLSAGFVERWSGKLINIHPALLPMFRGLDTHARALDAGVRVHGCTVHFVTPAMDEGPIIAQAAVPVLTSDDAETLGARVLKAEHRLYPLALRLVAEGKARMEGGKATFDAAANRERGGTAQLIAPDLADGPVSIEDLARFTP